MSLSTHEIGFATLDQPSGVDTLCLFVGEDERPLRGTAGYVDWRMCGALSQVLVDRFFTGSSGDCLLIPSDGRIAMSRIFAMGIGTLKRFGLEELVRVMGEAARMLSRAQVQTVALEIPGSGKLEEPARAAALLNQFVPEFHGSHVAVLSDKGVSRLLSGAGRPAGKKA
ncbi:MAG TPA: M17 family peptidase N-terminal domain-containing protein [Myxococcaceae bacterium]|nr:M17 family peptidase N-terminal domain-containing protein [Myxococcaceae bacterium]